MNQTILNIKPLSEYQTKEYESAKALAEKISEFYPAFAKARYSEYDGLRHFEGADVFLVHPTLKIRVSYNGQTKQYSFFNQSEHELKNMTYYSIKSVKDKFHAEKFPAPNGVGVLTTKKIAAWVLYYEGTFAALQVENDKHSNEIQAFRDSIKDLPVEWDKDRKNGCIVINGIAFRFEIAETYVSTWTEIDYSAPSGLATFLKLSDNKFKASK